MATELINDHHSHLAEAKIGYFFRSGTWTSNKREVWGKAQTVTGLMKHVTGLDFIITINQDIWVCLNDAQQRALVDHELQHCCKDEDKNGYPVWYTQGHDFEDFAAIIRRHGLWTEGLASITKAEKAHRQMTITELRPTGTGE